jgi:hypothetical protein
MNPPACTHFHARFPFGYFDYRPLTAGFRLPFFFNLEVSSNTRGLPGTSSPSNRGFLFKLKQSCSQVMACDFF